MRIHPVMIATLLTVTGCSGTSVALYDGEEACYDTVAKKNVQCPTGSVAVLNDETGGDVALLDQAFARSKVRGTRARITNAKPEALRARYGQLLDTLPKPPLKIILYFKKDSDDLMDGSDVAIAAMFDEIRARPGADVEIVGHTSTSGDSALNDAISLKRATKVQTLLANAGLDERIVAVGIAGRGEREPIDRVGEDDVESELNRRAEIFIK